MNLKGSINQIWLFAWTVLAEARNSRVLLSIGIISLVSVSLSLFVGEIAIFETSQAQIALTASFLRLSILFFLSLFSINSLVREMNEKMLLLYLSLPLSRSVFIIGKFLGFSILGMVFASIATLIVSLFADPYTSMLWGLSLMLESWIIIGLSFLCAFSFAQITTAFSAVSGIYLLSRSLSALLLIANNPLSRDQSTVSHHFMQGLFSLLDYLLPRLDRFTQTKWVMYGEVSSSEMCFVIQQALVYLLLLLSVTIFDFYRKNL